MVIVSSNQKALLGFFDSWLRVNNQFLVDTQLPNSGTLVIES